MRSLWAYGLAGLAATVMATSSTTACCSSILALLAPSESCCHQAETDDHSRTAECECCTADNGQPFAAKAAAQVETPVVSVIAVIELPAPRAARQLVSTFRWWEARPPPLLHRTAVLLI